jgi:hypothetical protein
VELNQRTINDLGLVDSNINFDYLRMRCLLAAIIKHKYDKSKTLVTRYNITKFVGIEDIQFVKPKVTLHKVKSSFTCYGSHRGHSFSEPRFRYMATHYLHSDNIADIALVPTGLELSSKDKIGINLIRDLVYSYSRALDREYMSIHPLKIDMNAWKPLMSKIVTLEPTLGSMNDTEMMDFIIMNLSFSLEQRGLMNSTTYKGKLEKTLQQACLESVKQDGLIEDEFEEMVSRYTSLMHITSGSSKLQHRMKRYTRWLNEYLDKKYQMSMTVILEYIILFHFHVHTVANVVYLNAEQMANEAIESDISQSALSIIYPEIAIKFQLLGIDYISEIINRDKFYITERLERLSDDNPIADIIIPEKLPSLKPDTILTGSEELTPESREIVYEQSLIPLSAMSTFNEISPLCDFAHKCSTSGAHPSIFNSITGSDSYSAQYGLFKLLKYIYNIDESTKICDLTGGRGDMQYVGRDLQLNVDTYSKSDDFTRVYHHPSVDFSKEYDIFQTETIKFITQYDIIHIDVSFIGKSKRNILDLILFMEMNNLTYTIRINSVSLEGYIGTILESLPVYDHYLIYPSSKQYKPYQMYLLGTPSEGLQEFEEINMKNTVAFRSVALGYSGLLSLRFITTRNVTDMINSATRYTGTERQMVDTIISITRGSYLKESTYYLKRYIAECEDDEPLHWDEFHLEEENIVHLIPEMESSNIYKIKCYEDFLPEDIGNVSELSKPYHLKHLQSLQSDKTWKKSRALNNCSEELLNYFRIHHPLQAIRTLCNIYIGMRKFNHSTMMRGKKECERKLRTQLRLIGPNLTRNQNEINLAIKLLVLSAWKEDYEYGILYCHRAISERKMNKWTSLRTLKAYRLISYHYSTCRDLIFHGRIGLKDFSAIENELLIREKQTIYYDRRRDHDDESYLVAQNVNDIIDGSLSKLFESLEKWSIMKAESRENKDDPFKFHDDDNYFELQFDLGIADRVNNALSKFTNIQEDRFGRIDIGDFDIGNEDPDLM